jgi:hypothetical protein
VSPSAAGLVAIDVDVDARVLEQKVGRDVADLRELPHLRLEPGSELVKLLACRCSAA